ncbi:MAG: hypothetical protein ACAI25_16580, partial [Planctomycetota bacterium]
LERRVRAHPDDPSALRGLGQALERAGERRRAFLMLCRLARTGDAEAWSRLHEWTPWPAEDGWNRTRRTSFEPLRGRPRRVRSAKVDARLDGNAIGGWGPVAVSDGETMVLGRDESATVTCISLRDFEVRWRAQKRIAHVGDPGIASCGDDLLVVMEDEDGRAILALLDGRTGEAIRRAVLPGAPFGIFASGDRVLVRVMLSSGSLLVALDAGEDFGRKLWERPIRYARVVSMNDRVYLYDIGEDASRTLHVCHLETGSVIRETGLPDSLDAAFSGDEQGLICSLVDGAGVVAAARETLEETWRRRIGNRGRPALGEKTIVTLARERGRAALHQTVALSRRNGRALWSAATPHDFLWQVHAIAGDVVYVANLVHGDEGSRIEVSGRDLATGRELFAWGKKIGLPPEGASLLDVVPGPARVVVVVGAWQTPVRVFSLEGAT